MTAGAVDPTDGAPGVAGRRAGPTPSPASGSEATELHWEILGCLGIASALGGHPHQRLKDGDHESWAVGVPAPVPCPVGTDVSPPVAQTLCHLSWMGPPWKGTWTWTLLCVLRPGSASPWIRATLVAPHNPRESRRNGATTGRLHGGARTTPGDTWSRVNPPSLPGGSPCPQSILLSSKARTQLGPGHPRKHVPAGESETRVSQTAPGGGSPA